MKMDKKLQKLIDILVKNSLSKTGFVENQKVRRFTTTLSKLPRQNAIFALTDYSKKLKRQIATTTLEVESATKLNPIQIKRITNAFKADYLVSDVKVKITPKLLGGLRIKISDKVFEDSVVSKIAQVKEAINS